MKVLHQTSLEDVDSVSKAVASFTVGFAFRFSVLVSWWPQLTWPEDSNFSVSTSPAAALYK
jgi:hypothetical protein